MAGTRETDAPGSGAYASVNGLDMYYEVHGAGTPLLVIPGGFMTIATMGPLLPALAQSRVVIAIEPQGHGHTRDIDRPLSYEQMADDAAALTTRLGYGRADILGFSAGANTALQIAIRHPDAVRKLVVISGNFRSDAEYAEIRAFAATFDPDMPSLAAYRDAYLRAVPSPEGWARLVAKARQLLAREYDWSGQIAAIRVPTLIMVGDADTMPAAHAVELFELLGGSTAASALGHPAAAQLAVLPGTTHFSILQRVDLLLPLITRFLDTPMPDPR